MTTDQLGCGSERGGVVAATRALSAGQLDEVATAAPWRGPVIWHQTAAGSTIAATGEAEVFDAGRWTAAVQGTITNRTEAAEILGVDSRQPAELAAAALAAPARGADLLRGSFRAVALDRATGEVRATRSVGGGRGLAWAHGRDAVAVATEPEQAALAVGLGNRPDHGVIDRYRSGRLRREDAFIEGADWLLPGSLITAVEASATVTLVELSVPTRDRPARQAVDRVERAIETAVERAIDGAATVASLATGGLDSSSLIGFAARHRKVDLAVTSRVRTLRGSTAEADLAAASMSGLAGDHRIIDLTVPDLFDGVVPLLPVTGPPGVLVIGLMAAGYEAAAEAGADVVLDGIGGDHLFSFNQVLAAMAGGRPPDLARQARLAPRGFIRLAPGAALRNASRRQRHNVTLGERLREWGVHADAAIRNRLAAHHGLRLEVPYLDEDLWRTVAGVPPGQHGPNRRLQRAAVASVLPHIDETMKVLYGDAQQRYFGSSPRRANRRAADFFVEHWLARGA